MAIAFAGTAPFGAAILEGLLDGTTTHAGREVALVISQPDRPAGRGRKVSSPAVAQLARDRGLVLLQPERTHDPEVIEQLQALGIGTIVVAAFGQMIREPLLTDYLLLNVHGSLLPAYRGAAPIERAIMAGLTETGVGIMQMEAGLDTGPVAAEGRVAIAPEDDAGTIYARCASVGVTLLHDALDAAAAGSLEFTPQPEAGATYAHKITAADRQLAADRPATEIHDRVRALAPHIGAFLEADGARVTIWRTRIASADDLAQVGTLAAGAFGQADLRLFLGAAAGTVLELLEVQPSGKRRMAASDWLRGLREPLQHVTEPVRQA